jgi:hypothetical protein
MPVGGKFCGRNKNRFVNSPRILSCLTFNADSASQANLLDNANGLSDCFVNLSDINLARTSCFCLSLVSATKPVLGQVTRTKLYVENQVQAIGEIRILAYLVEVE